MNERFYDVSDSDLRNYSNRLAEQRNHVSEYLSSIVAEQEIVTEELVKRNKLNGENQ